MKFTIDVELDADHTLKSAKVLQVDNDPASIVLNKAVTIEPKGESWLVFDELDKKRMIVLTQMDY